MRSIACMHETQTEAKKSEKNELKNQEMIIQVSEPRKMHQMVKNEDHTGLPGQSRRKEKIETKLTHGHDRRPILEI